MSGGPSMDSIKKKIISMKNEKDQAEERAEQNVTRCAELEEAIKASEEDHSSLLKRINALDIDVDKHTQQLDEVTSKLAAANKLSADSEIEIAALNSRVYLINNDLANIESSLAAVTEELNVKTAQANESESIRKKFETLGFENDEKNTKLEQKLAEALLIAADADKRFDETSRRVAILEVELERTEDRAESAETKILDLEEELKTVSNNMKALEISELEALAKEEKYTEEIKECTTRLKEAEKRAEDGERTLNKLQSELERLEDEIVEEKEKYKEVADDLEATLTELQTYA